MCTTFVGRASIRPTQSGTPIQTAAFFLLLSQGAVPQAAEEKAEGNQSEGHGGSEGDRLGTGESTYRAQLNIG